jgi:hypothetical protein
VFSFFATAKAEDGIILTSAITPYLQKEYGEDACV